MPDVSDDEYGGNAFEDHDTEVATVPLSHPIHFSNRNYSTYTKSSTPGHVEVPASSPRGFTFSSPPRSPTPLRPTPASQTPAPGPQFARMFAPPGTYFQPPGHNSRTHRGRSSTSELFTQEQKESVEISSGSEEERFNVASDSKQSFHARPIDQATDRVEESPVKNNNSSFSQFMYQPSQPGKRSADAMAEAYGQSRRLLKMPRQNGPARALPVTTSDLTLEGIEDINIRQAVERMQKVFRGNSVQTCIDALRKRNYHCEDAMALLADQQDTIDLTNDDDDIQSYPIQAQVNVKRVVAGSKTIQEKWGNATRKLPNPLPRPSAHTSPSVSSTAPAPKRKLLKAPPKPTFSHTPSPLRAPAAAVAIENSRRERAAESDIDEGVIVDLDDSDSDNIIAYNDNTQSEAELLQFLNKCTEEELNEVTSQPKDAIERVLTGRPFCNLDAVRAITIESQSQSKNGKLRNIKREVGTRLVDACLEVFETYNTIDRLVNQCDNLGRPIREEMRRFGFDASQNSGELELTEFDHDSGIGTPSSSVDGDERGSARGPYLKRLGQPRIMSKSLVMKDYQIIGLNWLALLHSKQMSGILADDMGLGKTCQVIAFITHLVESKKATGPHLIIVPGSTLENWLREFQNFSPSLDVRPYYGSQKDRGETQYVYLEERDEINVIVTTYDMATAPSDNKFLRRLDPIVCVFDEGHALKNKEAKRYQQLMRIPAQFRLLLTGTPLQNNLQELISLLAFIMPDVFREHQEDLALLFKHKAKTSDDSGKAALLSAERINRARSMMTPFILRRKKEQVMKHLPTKTCRVEYCELTKTQHKLYIEEAAKASTALGAGGISMKQKSNVMMDLRKAAIHPLLFRRNYGDATIKKLAQLFMQTADPGVVEELVEEDLTVMTDFELNRFCIQHGRKFKSHLLPASAFADSGKVATLVEILKRHIKNGDRTLVFSQFTMVMDILEGVFAKEEIIFSRLDGSTKMSERQDLIDQFTDDETIPVFMLSTKAGGAGINLASANKVIIFDSSFNPQDDIQAENRAHRVGQKREVEVIRLVTKDTIEVQIMALGQTKLALDNRIAGEAEGKGDDDAAAEGMRLVEQMLTGEVKIEVEGDVKVEDKEPTTAEVKKRLLDRKKADIKDDFMMGLKAAGLKVEG